MFTTRLSTFVDTDMTWQRRTERAETTSPRWVDGWMEDGWIIDDDDDEVFCYIFHSPLL
jgi:hypothetical protein